MLGLGFRGPQRQVSRQRTPVRILGLQFLVSGPGFRRYSVSVSTIQHCQSVHVVMGCCGCLFEFQNLVAG